MKKIALSSRQQDDLILYGRLQEKVHVASYTFERACRDLEALLEGDRWKLGGRFKAIDEFMDSLGLDKLRATTEQRSRIAKRIKELQPAVSNRQIAKTLGVGRRTIDRDVGPNGPPRSKNRSQNKGAKPASGPNGPPVSGAHAAKIIEKHEGGVAVIQDRRAERERTIGNKIIALPDKRYGVVYADPAWRFAVWNEDGNNRIPDNYYPTMSLDDVKALVVPSICADDAVLFLWATTPLLNEQIKVMEIWGFTYRSHWVWRKDKIGAGHWGRNLHELLLIGTRGNVPAPAFGTQPQSVIDAPVGRHSEKPAVFAEVIERFYPTIPKIELFARTARPGWDVWGLEAPVSDAAE